MTIKTSQISVGTTATVLVANDEFPEEVHIHIASGTLYLGGSDVTTANGYKLDANTTLFYYKSYNNYICKNIRPIQ